MKLKEPIVSNCVFNGQANVNLYSQHVELTLSQERFSRYSRAAASFAAKLL